ncbi:uncharacterized protein PgNI_08000 [Pyricularia grisea]|uniref:Thioester reductase (TE) domain-containing protein n=1 Tax=Pyricularia grisea TaxID=148305 RepID=A0A6P8AVC0_PYRGI|nr:uncharacterized protein PgNI_08000 [Pyricularia grisea]TLD06171.1 hypothetical protein PgNI_08000 [Pyricularia grisea]
MVTQVLHNKWPIDFNAPLAHIEPTLRAVRNVIEFAEGETRPEVVFVSLRYGEARHVASAVLGQAAERCGLRVSLMRVEQLGGSGRNRRGPRYGFTEWFSSMITTSRALGKLLHSLGADMINWLSVEGAAQAILELSASVAVGYQSSENVACFNIVNPKVSSWTTDLAPAVQDYYPDSDKPALIRLTPWFDELESLERTYGIAAVN